MWRRGLAIAVIASLLVVPSSGAQNPQEERGLLITPPRAYLEAQPGKTTKSSITVANITDETVNVNLAFEQFSVADYTYDYKFEPPTEDWISFEVDSVELKKTESRTVNFDIHVPEDARPGGHYFTLFAAMARGDGKRVRAATVLYLTVDGQLKKTSDILGDTMPLFVVGDLIPYSFDIKNTGNTHFLVYVTGGLQGVGASHTNETAHVLMPDKIRKIEGTIPAPTMPGIYQASYEIKDEDGVKMVRSQSVIYIPPWSWAFVIGLVWMIILLVRRRHTIS